MADEHVDVLKGRTLALALCGPPGVSSGAQLAPVLDEEQHCRTPWKLCGSATGPSLSAQLRRPPPRQLALGTRG